MSTQAEAVRAATDPGLRPLPVLEPVLVLDEGETEELVRTARAGIAMLSLQRRDVGVVAPGPAASPSADLAAAEVLLRTSLEECVEARRAEMRVELEQVRADSAAHVAAARHNAASMVADATDETIQLLLRGLRPQGAPNLRVVPDDAIPDPSVVARRARVDAEPVGASNEPESAEAPATAIEADLPTTADAPSALEASLTRAVTAAFAEVFQGAPATAAVEGQAVAPTPGLPVAPSSTPADATPRHAAKRAGVTRFLYADVILPMIAVVIVFVILLAWAG